MREQAALKAGDHPGSEIAEAVVQAAIFQAGGYKGPHPDTQTLKAAGLITDTQRFNFQPAVDLELRDRHFIMDDITLIPNQAGTTVAIVKTHVEAHSMFSPGKE